LPCQREMEAVPPAGVAPEQAEEVVEVEEVAVEWEGPGLARGRAGTACARAAGRRHPTGSEHPAPVSVAPSAAHP